MGHFSRSAGLLATVAFTAACALCVRADAPSALEQVLLTTLKQPSYHMTIVGTRSGPIEADVATPDRMHVVMKQTSTEMIVIGSTTYLKQHGSWRALPGMDLMKNMANPLQTLAAARGTFSVVDVGSKVFGGSPLHEYRVTNLKTNRVDLVYVDGGGRIARIEVGQQVVTMSKFGEPVRVAAPM